MMIVAVAVPVVVAAVLGLVWGALLPLPAYRLSVPWRRAGEPPVRPRGHCGHCRGELTRWLGWRCPRCAARLGPPPWLPGAVCALACAGLTWRFGLSLTLVPYLLVVFLGVLVAAVDLAAQRIPDALVLPGTVAAVLLFALLALATGAWGLFLRALAAGVALLVGYMVLAVLPGANVGGGDVVLAGLLGVYLGWLGWPVVLAGAMLPWLVQLPVALVALVSGRAGKGAMLPFGPALLAGAYLAVVGPPVLRALLAG